MLSYCLITIGDILVPHLIPYGWFGILCVGNCSGFGVYHIGWLLLVPWVSSSKLPLISFFGEV
jgi:hypothetical protein